jgi:hypothetical protein
LEYELKKLKEKKASEMSRIKTKHEVQVKEPVQETKVIQEQFSRPAVLLPATRLSIGVCDETITEESENDYRGCQDHTMSGTPCIQWDSVTATMEGGKVWLKNFIRGHNYCRNHPFFPQSSIYCYTSPTEYELCRPKGDGGFVGGDDGSHAAASAFGFTALVLLLTTA